MEIQTAGDINNAKKFSAAVNEFARQENAFVAAVSYDTNIDGKNETAHLYITDTEAPAFIKNIGKGGGEGSKAAGLFNPDKEFYINSFEGLENKSLARIYYIYPKSAGDAFRQYMTDEHNVDFFSSNEVIYLKSGYLEQIPGIALVAVALLVFFSFWTVTQYQTNSVKKLLGYSDSRILRHEFCEYSLVNLAALISSMILGFAACGIYNGLSGYKNLLADSITVSVPGLILLTLAEAVFMFWFYNPKTQYALKGKKPFKLLSCLPP